jgi:sterol desaturase/sphingolipid hydroxylase (fatty acid hydroxylase superfamily)
MKNKEYVFQSALLERYRETLAWFTYPFFMVGFVALYFWGLAQGFAVDTWVITVTVINFFTTLLFEQLIPRNKAMNYLHDSQSWNDIGHGIMQAASRPLIQSVAIVLFAYINQMRLQAFDQVWPSDWSFVAQFVLALMIASLMDYLVHRSFHTFERMWWFHAVHHDTPQMHIMKSARVHFGEEVINSALKPLPLILAGAPTDIIVFLGMWTVFDGNIAHANIHQRFPGWFHYVLGTVQLHNLHHARDRKYQDSNYSGSVPLWDVLFRTFNHPDKSDLGEMGLDNNPVPPNFLRQVLYPFRMQIALNRNQGQVS